jgi:hypothetical protein
MRQVLQKVGLTGPNAVKRGPAAGSRVWGPYLCWWTCWQR